MSTIVTDTKNDIAYYEGFAAGLRAMTEAYRPATGVRNHKLTLAWMERLATDPDRLMNGQGVTMVLVKDGKRPQWEYERKG